MNAQTLPKKTDWSICLAEWAVPFNQHKDILVFGKRLSHPFLALMDSGSNVVAEIHGNWPRKELSRPTKRLLSVFNSRIIDQEYCCLLAPVAEKFLPAAFLHATDGAVIYPKAEIRQAILEGPERRIMQTWSDAVEAFSPINQLGRPFYQYAPRGSGFANCQVLLRDLMEAVSIVPKIPDLVFAQTGWTLRPEARIS